MPSGTTEAAPGRITKEDLISQAVEKVNALAREGVSNMDTYTRLASQVRVNPDKYDEQEVQSAAVASIALWLQVTRGLYKQGFSYEEIGRLAFQASPIGQTLASAIQALPQAA